MPVNGERPITVPTTPVPSLPQLSRTLRLQAKPFFVVGRQVSALSAARRPVWGDDFKVAVYQQRWAWAGGHWVQRDQRGSWSGAFKVVLRHLLCQHQPLSYPNQ